MTISIRRAEPADAARVARFGARLFEQTFAEQNRAEDMAAYLASAFGETQQSAEIAAPGTAMLLMEADGALIAYAYVRRGPAPRAVGAPAPIELVRFYVDREWHGRGHAGTLMEAALDAARRLGGTTVWLGVWERNARAIAFYRKFGFVDAGTQTFVLGSDVQTDRLMVRRDDRP